MKCKKFSSNKIIFFREFKAFLCCDFQNIIKNRGVTLTPISRSCLGCLSPQGLGHTRSQQPSRPLVVQPAGPICIHWELSRAHPMPSVLRSKHNTVASERDHAETVSFALCTWPVWRRLSRDSVTLPCRNGFCNSHINLEHSANQHSSV